MCTENSRDPKPPMEAQHSTAEAVFPKGVPLVLETSCLGSGSHPGGSFAILQGHMVMPEDVLGCHN